MITDFIDVEPVVGQRDPGMILVGPLLSLSISSMYRYFYIAGNGGKVYETVGLGFVEVETSAQTQRADFIKKLESRFAEVLTFGSQLEMAHAVHTRWPNEETAKFLALAELEAKPKSTKVADQQESTDDNGSYAGVVPGDPGKQLVDEVAPKPVDHAKDIDAISRYVPPLALDEAHPLLVSRPAPTLVPSSPPLAALRQPLRGDRAVTERRRHSGLSQDDIASAILRLKPPAELGGVSRLPVEGARSVASIVLRFCAVGCAVALVAAALVTWAMVRPSMWQVADEAAPAPVLAPSISVSGNNDPSQAAAPVPASVPSRLTEASDLALQAALAPATVPPAPPSASIRARDTDSPIRGDPDPSQAASAVPPSVSNGHMEANDPALQSVPTPATVLPSPPSQPSQVASIQGGSVSVSRPQSLPEQEDSAARRLDAEEITTLVSRGTDFMKSGDLASARLLFRRAAEAGNASAALMLGRTFDPLVIQRLGAVGVVPDVAQARRWYEKAAALGSDAASQRLAKLPQTGQ